MKTRQQLHDAGRTCGTLECARCYPAQTTAHPLDAHLDAILRASGSALRHYSMAKTRDDMRAALQDAIDAERAALIERVAGERAALLKALEWALTRIGPYTSRNKVNASYCDEYDRAVAAIAKARGAA